MRTNPYEGGSDHSVVLAAGVPSVGEALREVLDLPPGGADTSLRAAVDRAIERLHLQEP